jgi:hypothetical protein
VSLSQSVFKSVANFEKSHPYPLPDPLELPQLNNNFFSFPSLLQSTFPIADWEIGNVLCNRNGKDKIAIAIPFTSSTFNDKIFDMFDNSFAIY